MSDQEEEQQVEKPFHVDRAKSGRAGCKKCKQKISQGELRLAKLGHNPFGSGFMKMWHHIPCIFEVFKKQRATTKKIESPDDIGGWEDLEENDKQEIMSYFDSDLRKVFESFNKNPIKSPGKVEDKNSKKRNGVKDHKDNSFRMFRKICADVANESSYLAKTKVISDFFEKGTDGESFKGDIELWCKLLLPGVIIRVYNLQSKQLVKLFSRILETNQEEMLEDLENGDVAETISSFFERNKTIPPSPKSILTIQDVDQFLESLSKMTKEDEQSIHFKKIIKKCTPNDLQMILRLIKHDLRINAGPKHILEALHPDAYKAFQASRDLKTVIENALKAKDKNNEKKVKDSKGMSISISLMTPVLPMLAQVCKSVKMAFDKCPNGMFSEIKYDGERVQVHKQGDTFKYFSRSLKPVLAHKVAHFKDFIRQAFPHGEDLILDAEILMVDNETGKPLPFGTLGIHKKSEFKDANVCLFVFDCIYYNGKSLLNTTIKERKEILKKNMREVKNHIMFSEMEEIHKGEDLEKMLDKVFKLGLEGLVLKDLKSTYEPGKRHWLKVKKDYLFGGAIADTADLVVLGAWFGTGSKGGIMSSFLMGSYDPKTQKWVTVTKVSNGHDDDTLHKIQKELQVVKISKDPAKVPKWLKCNKPLIPDFVASDPKKMPVWEITGAEFTRNQAHTADGISIRFPRVTKIRYDKDWTTATNLDELKDLYKKSKQTSDFDLSKASKTSMTSDEEESPRGKKRKLDSDDNKNPKKAKESEEDNPYDQDTDDNSDTDIESENIQEEDEEEEFTHANLPNPLHDIFTNCVIDLPKDYNNYKLLRRYIIAYDGVLHDREKNNCLENSNEKVTHVVHLKKLAETKKEKFWAKDVRHVHINWIWDSIKLLEKQPESKYVITAKES